MTFFFLTKLTSNLPRNFVFIMRILLFFREHSLKPNFLRFAKAYIQYMKFSRRAEGIKSTRDIFKKAREDSRTKFHVYVAAALMEYYCTKNKEIAFRIFELGLKKFPNIADYIMAYVDYLSHLNGKQV